MNYLKFNVNEFREKNCVFKIHTKPVLRTLLDYLNMAQRSLRKQTKSKKSKYFPTLVAIVQTPIYAKEHRHITPRECARLQSFPDSFKIHEKDKIAYKQFGNAVNVDVVHFVMNRVFILYNAFEIEEIQTTHSP